MTSPIISDSEGEDRLEESRISKSRLRRLIRQSREDNSQFEVKKTSLLSDALNRTIHEFISNYESEAEEAEEANNEQERGIEVPSTTPRRNTVSREALDLSSTWTDYTTGSRTRDLPFYRKHIYVIDCVEYNMAISRERAMELVKQNPQFIEMYQNDTLVKFLKGQGKSKSTKPKSKSTKKITSTPEEDSQDLQFPPIDESDEEPYLESNESGVPNSENSSSSSSETEESDQEGNNLPSDSQDLSATVKGRQYNNIEQLARGSGLPKSFFSLQKQKAASTTKTILKRTIQGDRVGLAKKKVRLSTDISNDFRVYDTPIFPTEDTRLRLPRPEIITIDDEPDEVIEVEDEPNNDLLMFSNNFSTGNIFFRAEDRFHEEKEDDIDAMEDVSSGIKPMLAGTISSRKTKIKSNTPRKKRDTDGLTKVKKFKRNPVGSARSPASTSKAPRALNRSRPSTSIKKTPRTIFESYNRQLSIQSGLKYIDSDEEPLITSKTPSRTSKKDPKPKRGNDIHLFTPGPQVFLRPRAANTSTTVSEGLSDKFAIVKKPNRGGPLIVNETQSLPLPVFEEPVGFEGRFKNSRAYKVLFKGETPTTSEFNISFGGTTIRLSKLNPNAIEKLDEIFTILLKPSLLKSSSIDRFISSLLSIIEFCSDLDKKDAQSLIRTVDNFRFKLEASIRRRGKIFDAEYYFLGFSMMLYYCCFKIFETHSLKLFDFKSKAKEMCNLFFWFVADFDRSVLTQKLKDKILFSEAITMMFLSSETEAWLAFEYSEVSDMEFLRDLCAIFEPENQLWKKVRNILKSHYNDSLQFDKVKRDFVVINSLINNLSWRIDEDTISMMSECLKKNRFQNFPNEPNNPAIFGQKGIVKDTTVNLYLNILMEFATKSDKLSARLLEKIIPVSKVSTLDAATFCNRVNILLCLSLTFEKNLESRIAEIMNVCDFESESMNQKIFMAASMMISINNNNKIVSRLDFLKRLINSVISRNKFKIWENFIKSISFQSLLPKTQRNFMSIISEYQNSTLIMRHSSTLIKSFISTLTSDDMKFLKSSFGSINPNMFPEIWCHVSGSLVSNGADNWSRLIQFNNLQDEPYFYTYILKHSGSQNYVLENETFISSLIKGVIKRRFSFSLNSYMREISKLDHNYAFLKSSIIQTNRLQITLSVISTILKNVSLAAKTRYLSLAVNLLKYELNLLGFDDRSYLNYARKVIEFINMFGYEFVHSSTAFEDLCSNFKIERRISNSEVNQLVNSSGNINESLRFIQSQLIQSLKSTASSKSFSEKFVPLLSNHTTKKFTPPNEQISDSKLYALCASISINIQLLSNFANSSWIFIHELIKTLYKILVIERNFTRIDIFAILSTLKTFPFILNYRNSLTTTSSTNDYQLKLETLTLISVYKILQNLYHFLSGSNDLEIFIDLAEVFTNRRVLNDTDYFHVEFTQTNFLIKPPEFIKDLVLSANITNSGSLKNLKMNELRESLEDNFSVFMRLIDDEFEEDEGVLSDQIYLF